MTLKQDESLIEGALKKKLGPYPGGLFETADHRQSPA
jgi:hypothetical protein